MSSPEPSLCSQDERKYRINDAMMKSMAVGKVFKDNTKRVNSLDFTADGKWLLSSSDDESLNIYDVDGGQNYKCLHSHKYGVDLAKFVHSGKQSCIAASRNDYDYNLRYWDLYENKYIRYFKGHYGTVVNLEVHPFEDRFISASVDRSVLVWDLRKEKPVARIGVAAAKERALARANKETDEPLLGVTPYATVDQQGMVLAVTAGQHKIHLFDIRNLQGGEFTTFNVTKHIRNNLQANLKGLKFSPCGRHLLVHADDGQMFTLDAFEGHLQAEYRHGGGFSSGGSASFFHDREGPRPVWSPDSKYVLSGGTSGEINVWRSEPSRKLIREQCAAAGLPVPAVGDELNPKHVGVVRPDARLVARLEGHTGFPRCVMFNPTKSVIASGCLNMALWVPKEDPEELAKLEDERDE